MLPVETINALFASPVKVGKTTLKPVTLAHIAAFAALGITNDSGIDVEHALLASWLLTMDSDGLAVVVNGGGTDGFEDWTRRTNPDAYELFPVVNRMLLEAYSTFVPGQDDGKQAESVFSTPTGFGYSLEFAELLCHEYGWDFHRAINTPLVLANGLVCCARKRNGGKNAGPDYYERIQLGEAKAAMDAMRKAQEAKNG